MGATPLQCCAKDRATGNDQQGRNDPALLNQLGEGSSRFARPPPQALGVARASRQSFTAPTLSAPKTIAEVSKEPHTTVRGSVLQAKGGEVQEDALLAKFAQTQARHLHKLDQTTVVSKARTTVEPLAKATTATKPAEQVERRGSLGSKPPLSSEPLAQTTAAKAHAAARTPQQATLTEAARESVEINKTFASLETTAQTTSADTAAGEGKPVQAAENTPNSVAFAPAADPNVTSNAVPLQTSAEIGSAELAQLARFDGEAEEQDELYSLAYAAAAPTFSGPPELDLTPDRKDDTLQGSDREDDASDGSDREEKAYDAASTLEPSDGASLMSESPEVPPNAASDDAGSTSTREDENTENKRPSIFSSAYYEQRRKEKPIVKRLSQLMGIAESPETA